MDISKEVKTIKESLQTLNIPSERLKSIQIYYQKTTSERVDPVIKIKLYK